jgi:hypothetical protein
MEFIGDLERAFASAIYPNRVLIAALATAVLAVIVYVAWRRRWDRIARRHPVAAILTLAVAAVIIPPTGWYLGSPLFISTSIDEPAPVAVASPVASRVTPSAEPSPVDPSVRPSPAPSPSPLPSPSPEHVERTGSFEGADEFHFGRGTARLVETGPGAFTVRLEDFAVRNGPDLFVYLSPSAEGYAEDAIELGRLKADRGNQNYEVPAGTDVAAARSVVIWCRQFRVLFATAELG